MNFIEKAGLLEECYVSTGLAKDVKFNICNVDTTETELVVSDLDFGEIRIPLNNLPVLVEGEDTIMEVWANEQVRFEF